MKILISLSDSQVTVEAVDDLKRLSAVILGEGDLEAALSGFASVEGSEHLWVDISALKELASRQEADSERWSANYDTMIAYAQRSGWVDATSTYVRVHVAPE